MPYKGFDVNKDDNKQANIDALLGYYNQEIFTIINKVKKDFNDSDYQAFIKELKENLGE